MDAHRELLQQVFSFLDFGPGTPSFTALFRPSINSPSKVINNCEALSVKL
jgi:hypothetical protein